MTATPEPAARRRRLRLRVWLPIAVAVVLLVPLGVLWWSSLLPSSLSVTIGNFGVAGYAVNGTSPGPTIRAREGQLVDGTTRTRSRTSR